MALFKRNTVDSIGTFLGPNAEFKGRLSMKGAVRIDCCFYGDIDVDGTLIVGPQARIESRIHVTRAIISGEIRGNVTADKHIEIRVPGKIFGDIESPTVTIQEGAMLQGNCRTTSSSGMADAPLAITHNREQATIEAQTSEEPV